MDILNLTASELSALIKKGEISVLEATQAVLKKIKETNPQSNTYITLAEEQALSRAKEVQAAIARGDLAVSPLAGVPIALKDNICTQNIRTTCGSKMLENFTPPYNATVVNRLNDAGAILIGKLNMDEFAMGTTTESSFFGTTLNPWDSRRVPGGSSGGSAAAISLKQAFCTLGTDTGGSIRQPAAHCGVTGFKPSYGAVSRYGLIAHSSSLDQIGPIAKNAIDCAACLEVISGKDRKDSTSVCLPETFDRKRLNGNIQGLKIGIPKEYFNDSLSDEIRAALNSAIRVLEDNGAIIKQMSLPLTKYATSAYYIISCAEASSNLSRYDGIKYGFSAHGSKNLNDLYVQNRTNAFGSETKRRILFGTFVLAAGQYEQYYQKAIKVKNMIKHEFENCFKECDVLITPVTPSTAPFIGETVNDPLKVHHSDMYTTPANLAGLPAISVPCGFDKDGIPIGMQILGPAFSDFTILNVAHSFQKITDFHKKSPGGNNI